MPRYARAVPLAEIADARNDYNLNLPRYIDSSEPEDLHDITAHLRGGIPVRDLTTPPAPGPYWTVLPGAQQPFEPTAHADFTAHTARGRAKAAIGSHTEFQVSTSRPRSALPRRAAATQQLKAFEAGWPPG